MTRKQSAGLLLYRETPAGLEVLLVHPGGPLWAGRDEGAWSIPKGEFTAAEAPLQAALREFEEETGAAPPAGEPLPLQPVRQPSGKIVHAWALRGDFDVAALKSNLFSMEWPPKSGQRQAFPEVDQAAWLTLDAARRKIFAGQRPLLAQFEARLARSAAPDAAAGAAGRPPDDTPEPRTGMPPRLSDP